LTRSVLAGEGQYRSVKWDEVDAGLRCNRPSSNSTNCCSSMTLPVQWWSVTASHKLISRRTAEGSEFLAVEGERSTFFLKWGRLVQGSCLRLTEYRRAVSQSPRPAASTRFPMPSCREVDEGCPAKLAARHVCARKSMLLLQTSTWRFAVERMPFQMFSAMKS
jgi:hypothetical protein